MASLVFVMRMLRLLSTCIKHIISPSQTYVKRGHGKEKVDSKILNHDDGSLDSSELWSAAAAAWRGQNI